jgi:hypothetical protein
LAHQFLKEQGFNAAYTSEEEIDIVKISKEQQEPISKDIIISYCKKVLLGSKRNSEFLKRRTIPCQSGYNLLTLVDNYLPILDDENWAIQIQPSFDLDLISPRMLFPLARIGEKITVGDLDILAKRVYKNRADEKVTEEQIKQKYQEFITFLDTLMKDEEDWIKLRGSDSTLSQPITTYPAVKTPCKC